MIDDRVVDVGAACLGVAARCEDLEDSAAKVHQCNIVGSSSEAEDHDFHLLVRLVQAIGKACCGGLVDYPIHFEACDLTRILCCLPLVVVEVRGNSDDNLLYRSHTCSFSISLTRLSLRPAPNSLLPCHFNYTRTKNPSLQQVPCPDLFQTRSLLLVRDNSESGFMIIRIEH